MTQDLWSAVDRYICDLLVPSDSVLDEVLEESAAAGLPPIAVTPNLGKLLYLIARIQGAKSVLEIGTLAGYSTIWLGAPYRPAAAWLRWKPTPNTPKLPAPNLIRAGLADVVELRLGSALDTLPQLAAEGRGPFDLIFVDAEKRDNPAYYEWSMKLARRGSVIVFDNVVRDGAVIDPNSPNPSVQGIRRFNDIVAADSR